MTKRKPQNERDGVSITVDTGKLPVWTTFMAITMSYAESKAFLEYALGSTDYTSRFIDFGYRMYFTNPTTGERRALVQRGGEDSRQATTLGWDIAISILTLIRLQNYSATFGESGVIGLYFSFGGDDKRKSDMDRMMLLLEERPEFEMLSLEEVTDAKAKKEDPKEKAARLSTPKAQNGFKH